MIHHYQQENKLTKCYWQRVEERVQKELPFITGDGPKQIHHWPLPFWPRDRHVVLEILEGRKRGRGPESNDWHWTEQKIREIERSAKTWAIVGISGLILTAGTLIVAILALLTRSQ